MGSRPAIVVSLLAAVTLVVLTVTVGIAKSPVDGRLQPIDAAWVSQANTACQTSVQSLLRAAPANGSPAPVASVGGTGPTPAAVAADARRVNQLADTLAALKPAQAANGPVTGWLAMLREWAGDRLSYAAALANPASGSGSSSAASATQSAAAASATASAADSFATFHALDSCRLGPASNSSPLVSIP
jgi:hypothetical protein